MKSEPVLTMTPPFTLSVKPDGNHPGSSLVTNGRICPDPQRAIQSRTSRPDVSHTSNRSFDMACRLSESLLVLSVRYSPPRLGTVDETETLPFVQFLVGAAAVFRARGSSSSFRTRFRISTSSRVCHGLGGGSGLWLPTTGLPSAESSRW